MEVRASLGFEVVWSDAPRTWLAATARALRLKEADARLNAVTVLPGADWARAEREGDVEQAATHSGSQAPWRVSSVTASSSVWTVCRALYGGGK